MQIIEQGVIRYNIRMPHPVTGAEIIGAMNDIAKKLETDTDDGPRLQFHEVIVSIVNDEWEKAYHVGFSGPSGDIILRVKNHPTAQYDPGALIYTEQKYSWMQVVNHRWPNARFCPLPSTQEHVTFIKKIQGFLFAALFPEEV